MSEKIELTLMTLVYLYNLLVDVLQKQAEPEKPPINLDILMSETNAALKRLAGDVAWFVCVKESCDYRPFRLTASELADAQGVICCDTCGQFCHRVTEDTLQRPLI